MNFEDVLERNGVLVFTNKGNSMMPLLKQDKDVMVIRKSDTYKKYDAVLFKRDNGLYILHRILKVYDNGYYIVGDNCISGEFVRPDQILGVLTTIKKPNKEIHSNDFGYKIYILTRPCHRMYLRARRIAGKIKRYVKRRKNEA